jgi:hypothetical protein
MVEAASTSETLVNFYQTAWCYNPEDSHVHTRQRENLKSYKYEDEDGSLLGCSTVKSGRYTLTDDGGSKLLSNIGEYLSDCTVLHPRRQPSSS